jgi:hypothetical protein
MWRFDMSPYDRGPDFEMVLANGIRIYTEDGNLIVDPPDDKDRWALCEVMGNFNHTTLTDYDWICRLYDSAPEDPADEDYMREISI